MSLHGVCLLVALAASPAKSGSAASAAGKCRAAPAPSLLGSTESLDAENCWVDSHKLERYRDRARLRQAIAADELVSVSDTDSYFIDQELGEEDPDVAELYVYARPWVKDFLDQFLGQAHAELGFRFALTSLVRPKDYQSRLRQSNSAAAKESTHTTGSTVDIAFEGLTWKQKQWVRKKLLELESRGLIMATEEVHNGCFHVFVSSDFKTLAPVCSPDDSRSP